MRRILILALILAITHTLYAMSSSHAKETDADVPLGGISASLQPDLFTGTLTGSIPIEVPPGRNGMQPNLALTYASGGGNGWVGMGWKLEMGTIERQTRWGVLYSPTSAEEQAGKVYTFRVNGMSGDLVQDSVDPNLYRAKIEGGFARIKKLTTGGWEITDKKGTKYFFGRTTAFQIQDPAVGIFKWCLERVEDRDGNYMTITYTGDQGQGYLSQIDYTGNGATAPTNTVKFYLENRSDAPDLYMSNFNIKTAKRLKTIEVKANGTLMRAYQLNYDPSTLQSVLASVQQFGKDAVLNGAGLITGGTALPANAMTYSTSISAFSNNTWSSVPGWAGSNLPISGGDFDGDGKSDLLVQASGQFYVGTSTGTGFSLVSWLSVPGWAGTYLPMAVGDFDGDGKSDLLVQASGQFYVGTSTGTGFSLASWLYVPGWAGTYLPMDVGDFNGDGKSDLLVNAYQSGAYYVGTSTGAAFNLLTWLSVPGWVGAGALPMAVGDFNGDGKSDLLVNAYQSGTYLVGTSTGAAFNLLTWLSVPGWVGAGALPMEVGDFNGDGKSDLLVNAYQSGTYLVGTSTGGAFNLLTWLSVPGWVGSALPILGSDFNGDGRSDLLVYAYQSGQFCVATAQGGTENTVPNLLTNMSNGLGGNTAITYVPSTQSQFQNTPGALLFPVQTVSSVSICDNWNGASCVQTSSVTGYVYTKGYHQIGERDFRGFKTSVVTSPGLSDTEKTVTTTWFHQGNEVNPIDTEDPRLANGYMKGRSYRVEVRRKSDNLLYSKTETSYLPDQIGVATSAPWFTPTAVVTASIYDSAGVLAKQTQSESVTYDAYGNVTLAYNRGDATNNNALTSDDTTTAITFGNYDTPNWLVAFPTIQTTYAGLGIGGIKLTETKYFYDGASSCTTPAGNLTPTKGHATKVERYLDQGGSNPVGGMEYNSYGSLTCNRDPNGNVTTLVYDPTSTFLLTSTNAMGQLSTTTYYGVNGVAMDTGLYGQAKSVIDPNNQTTTRTYDVFGRALTITTPDGLITTMAYNYGGTFVVSTQNIQRTTSGGGLAASLVSKTYFDGLGRTTKKESPGAADGGGALKVLATETQYDVRGLIKQTSLPYIQGTESVTGRWRTMSYDAVGRMVQSTNPDSTNSQVCYNGWTTTTLDPKLHKKVETKDAYGRLVTVQEYTGQATSGTCAGGSLYATTNYQYDLLGNLLSVTDAKGNVSTMTYDTLSRKLTMHDPDMGNWSYTYDASGNLLAQVDAKNQKLCFSYDALNRRIQKNYGSTTVACGTNTVVYAYDDTVAANNGKGRLKQVTDQAQSVTFQYDSRGRITQSAKILDGTTYTTTSVYDGLGRLTTVNYPTTPIKTVTYTYDGPQLKSVLEGATTYMTYAGWNALGQPGMATFGNGVVTTNTYANTNNTTCPQQTFRLCTLNTVSVGVPSTGAPTAPATLTATPVAASTTQLDLSWSTATDDVGVTGYRIERCQGVGCTTFIEVGTTAAGVTTYSNTGLTTGNPYTYRVRAIDGLNGLGPYSPTATAVTTDTTAPNTEAGVGIMVVSTSRIDLTWEQPTEGSYLWDYRVERCQGTSCTNFVEIAATAVTRYSDTGLTPATSYRYRVRCLDYAGNAGAYSSIYTQTTMLPADVTPPTAPGSLTATPVPSARIDLSWTAATDAGGITDYRIERCRGVGCSDFVQIARTTPPTLTYSNMNNHLLDGNSYTYRVRATDTTGNFGAYSASATAVATDSVNPTTPSALVVMASDAQALLTWTRSTDLSDSIQYQVERCQGASCTTFVPVATVPVTTFTNTGLTTNTVYNYRIRAVDSTNHLSAYSGVGTATTAQGILQAMTYSFDNAGNVQDLADATVAANAGDQHFAYDDLDRLTLANGPYGTGGANASFTYQYNEIGNLTLNSQLSATAYGYPTSGASSVRPHAVTTAGANSYTYDNNGNMLTGAGRTYTWNPENKPLTVMQGGTTTTFVYDGDGGRVKKIVGTTTTRYISKLYECDNTSCSRFIWAGSTRIATIASNGTVNYWHGDHLGSSSVITDSTGAKVENITYYPYGGTRTNQSFTIPAIDVPYKYTGKELDNTGLYYYEARYYDPTLARFISADTIVSRPGNPQGLNRYTYVGNNPFKYTDPTGHFSFKIGKFFNRLFDPHKTLGNVFRGAMWAFAPYTMVFLDPATRTQAVSVTAGVVVYAATLGTCPECGVVTALAVSGAVSGATSAAIDQSEGKQANILRSALGSAVGATLTYGLDRGLGFNSIGAAAIGGASKGALSQKDPTWGGVAAEAGVSAGAAFLNEAALDFIKNVNRNADLLTPLNQRGYTIEDFPSPPTPRAKFVEHAAEGLIGHHGDEFFVKAFETGFVITGAPERVKESIDGRQESEKAHDPSVIEGLNVSRVQ